MAAKGKAKSGCDVCGEPAGLTCPCRSVKYCGRKCQVKAWGRHKLICSARGPTKKKEAALLAASTKAESPANREKAELNPYGIVGAVLQLGHHEFRERQGRLGPRFWQNLCEVWSPHISTTSVADDGSTELERDAQAKALGEEGDAEYQLFVDSAITLDTIDPDFDSLDNALSRWKDALDVLGVLEIADCMGDQFPSATTMFSSHRLPWRQAAVLLTKYAAALMKGQKLNMPNSGRASEVYNAAFMARRLDPVLETAYEVCASACDLLGDPDFGLVHTTKLEELQGSFKIHHVTLPAKNDLSPETAWEREWEFPSRAIAYRAGVISAVELHLWELNDLKLRWQELEEHVMDNDADSRSKGMVGIQCSLLDVDTELSAPLSGSLDPKEPLSAHPQGGGQWLSMSFTTFSRRLKKPVQCQNAWLRRVDTDGSGFLYGIEDGRLSVATPTAMKNALALIAMAVKEVKARGYQLQQVLLGQALIDAVDDVKQIVKEAGVGEYEGLGVMCDDTWMMRKSFANAADSTFGAGSSDLAALYNQASGSRAGPGGPGSGDGGRPGNGRDGCPAQ